MPRPTGDHDARRREIAEAVLRVIESRGFTGLTLRSVAAELGASTGVVTHYFATKHDLTAFALQLLARSVDERRRPPAAPGLPTLRMLVHGMLPMGAAATTANRVWISSWDAALADPTSTASLADTYADSRARIADAIRDGQDAGEIVSRDSEQLAAGIHAFALGLAIQAIIDPAAFPAERLMALADDLLDALSTAPVTH